MLVPHTRPLVLYCVHGKGKNSVQGHGRKCQKHDAQKKVLRSCQNQEQQLPPLEVVKRRSLFVCWNRKVRQVLRRASWKHREDLSRSLRSRVHHHSRLFFSAVVGCCRDSHTDRLLPIPTSLVFCALEPLGAARTASGHEPPVSVQHRETETQKKKRRSRAQRQKLPMREHLWNRTTDKMRSNANDPCPVVSNCFWMRQITE